MEKIIKLLFEEKENITTIIFNTPIYKSNEFFKIIYELKENKGQYFYHQSKFFENKVIHNNFYDFNSMVESFETDVQNRYRNIIIRTHDLEYTILMNKKGNYKILKKSINSEFKIEGHNSKKNYIIQEGKHIEWLYYLGITNNEGYVKKEKQKKFKQINKFLEIVSNSNDSVDYNSTIIDFGSGKSYLTFALYYYFNILQNKNVKIIGLDLKEDVIDYCNDVAKALDFKNLNFIAMDIKDFKTDDDISMVVSLHACDTATDFAIYNAIKWNTKVIMCVPCCQKEINQQISNKKLDMIMKHGIQKEKFSSLLTDSIRGYLMEAMGYNVDIMEFIDMEHTPKNILIRGVKGNKKNIKSMEEFFVIKDEYKLKPTLYELLKDDLEKVDSNNYIVEDI